MHRFMRLIVFFDLPMTTSTERRNYARFRKYLIKTGFMMMQQSVYCKLVLNGSQLQSLTTQVIKNKPPNGIVQLLSITEKQFGNILSLVDEAKIDVVNDNNRTLIL